MKKFIETLQNIWKIKELRNRILYTILLLFIFRLGTFVVLPGVNPGKLEALIGAGSQNNILGVLNSFAGGAFYRAGIFALGIMPYISASIVIQILTLVVPSIKKKQQEGESGRRLISQYTRALTIVITIVQGLAYVGFLRTQFSEALVSGINPTLFTFSTLITLTAGTLFVMWMGEKITDRGIGQGVSLLITVGIIASLPGALIAEFGAKNAQGAGGLLLFALEILLLFGIIILTIALVQATRKIPIENAKRMINRSGIMATQTGKRDFLPVKLNASGVMPIIFAQALLFLPATLVGRLANENSGLGMFIQNLSNFKTWEYSIVTFLLVVIFTYFYTALIIQPKDMAENLKRQGSFIPGVRPGKQTATFIENVIDRITLPGSIFLALIAILPAFIVGLFGNVVDSFALFFGGTSLLIMVAVVLDTLRDIESYLLLRHYDGLMEGGRMKGRQQTVGASF